MFAAILILATACSTAGRKPTKASATSRGTVASSTATPTSSAQSPLGAYFAAGDHVYALDSHTGAARWTFVTGNGTALGGIDSLTVMAGMVFAHGTGPAVNGHPTRTLYALDAATGNLRWTLHPTSSGRSAINEATPWQIVGDVVYLVAPGAQVPHGVYAVDMNTGAEIWGVEDIAGSMALDQQAIYIAQILPSSDSQSPSDGLLTALNRSTGAQLWQLHGNTYSQVLVADGNVITTWGPTATVAALDPATGQTRWSVPVDSNANIQLIGGSLELVDQSSVSALDPTTGKQLWRVTVPAGAFLEGKGATLCLSYQDQSSYHLIGLDATTGVSRWTLTGTVPAGGYGGLSGFGEGACYARTDLPNEAGSTLLRIDATTGTTTWTVDCGGQVVGALGVSSDALYMYISPDRSHQVVKALSLADGSTLWQYPVQSDFGGAFTVG